MGKAKGVIHLKELESVKYLEVDRDLGDKDIISESNFDEFRKSKISLKLGDVTYMFSHHEEKEDKNGKYLIKVYVKKPKITMKYTKGKWEIIGELDELEIAVQNSPDPKACDGFKRICLVTPSGYEIPNYEESKANARLIAAAPELLEALIELEDISSGIEADLDSKREVPKEFIKELRYSWLKAQQAINKATK